MDIRIKSLHLKDFKSFKDYMVDFGEATNIYGENKSGKSTIINAFYWLLFGKDALNRENFNIKPRDSQGKTDPDVTTEVTGVFSVNGVDVELKRTCHEDWVLPKGEEKRVFTGNKYPVYINGVPAKASEFAAKVQEISAPDITIGKNRISVLRLLSDPEYFNKTLSWEERRKILFDIAPPLSDMDIITSNPELAGLDELIKDKGIEGFIKESKPKVKKIADDIADIPVRINEVKVSMPEELDFENIKNQLAEKMKFLDSLDNKLLSLSGDFEEYKVKEREAFGIEQKMNDVKRLYEKDCADKHNDLTIEADKLNRSLDSQMRDLNDTKRDIADTEKRIEAKSSEFDKAKAKYQEIIAETFTEPDVDNFICPTCKRHLEQHDIDTQIEEMRTNFNTDHAERIKESRDLGRTLNTRIAELKELKDSLEKTAATFTENIETAKQQLEAARKAVTGFTPVPFEESEYFKDYKVLQEKHSALKENLQMPETNKDEILASKKVISGEISELEKQLATKDQITKANARLMALAEEEKTLIQAKALIEKQLYQCNLFEKIKVSMLEDNLSSMFKYTKIKLIHKNEKDVETQCCTATLDGIMYDDVNTAGKITISLDIINTLSKAFNLTTPVFFDCRESVTNIIDTEQQVINTYVRKMGLTVYHEEKLKTERESA